MEPPPLLPVPKNAKKKRVFMEPDVIEIPPPEHLHRTKSNKQPKLKQVSLHEVIDIDEDEDLIDVMILDKKIDTKNKGKAIKDNSDGYNEATDALANHNFDHSMDHIGDLGSDFLYADDDEYTDHFSDDFMDFDEYPSLQAHFDSVDIPPGVEASVPWLPDFFNVTKNTNGIDSFHTSSQMQLNTVGSQSSKPVDVGKMLSSVSNYSMVHASGVEQSSIWSPSTNGQSKKKALASQLGGSSSIAYGGGPSYGGYSTFDLNNQGSTTNLLYASSALGGFNYPTVNGPSVSWYESKMQSSLSNPTGHSNFYDPFHALHNLPEEGAVRTPKNVNEDDILRKFQLFKRFDTVEDHSDHHYTSKGSALKQQPKNWAKRIQEEWRILEKDLPDSIFVRAYETRMELLRAVIVGAEGTPYHDGLFFFDVFFPNGYPKVPPLVYYHSGGLRLNPNLYSCGKVCLSLLGTWHGNKNEKWLPCVSTVLQVLVSIQALILNQKPFFNEPGYERMSGSANGEKQSQQYNENTFFLSLRTMVYTMRRPPKHFEDYVMGHFHKHARDILVACKAYMDGAQVGCLVKGGVQDVDEGDKSCSKTFKDSLPSYVDMLVKEFSQIGVKDAEKFLTSAEAGNDQVGNMNES